MSDIDTPVADAPTDDAPAEVVDAPDVATDTAPDADAPVDATTDAAPDADAVDAPALDADAAGDAAPAKLTTAPVVEKPADAKPAEDPAAAEAAKVFNQRVEKFNTDFSALRQKATSGRLDALDDGPAAIQTLVEGIELLAQELGRVDGTVKATQQKSTQSEEYEQSWTAWAAANADIGRKTGEQWFGDEVAKVRKQYPSMSADTIRAVASDRFGNRVALEKAKRGTAKPSAPAASNNNAQAPRARTQIAPTGTGARPAAKNETAAERVLRELGPISKAKLY